MALQGQALLSLGLSQKLYDLQTLPKDDLPTIFEKRENLLRLVDPSSLGYFKWIAFEINNVKDYFNSLNSKFLKEPFT